MPSDEMKYLLSTDSLQSKWGFEDGDIFNDIIYDLGIELGKIEGYESYYGLDHDCLIHFVETKLLPLTKCETYRISSIHNPIRTDDEDIPYAEVYVSRDEIVDWYKGKQNA